MTAFFVASTVVTLMQYLRIRRRALLPLLALFAFLAAAHDREPHDRWARVFHLAAGAAGLVQLAVLSPRHPPAR